MKFPTFELFLALRYFHSRRRRPLARVTGGAAVLSLMLGVAALLAALALGHGWRDETADKLLRGAAHMVITRRDGAPLPDWRVYAAQVRQVAGVAQVSGTSYEGALLNGPKGTSYAVVRGVDARDETARAGVRQMLTEGAENFPDAPAHIVIGAELAARTGLHSGDQAELITGAAALRGGEAQRQTVRVAGLFRSGWHETDAAWAYVPLPLAARLTGAAGDAATALDVRVQEPYAAGAVTTRLRALLGADFTVTDWQEMNRPLFSALALAQRAAYFVTGLLALLAALNVLATLVLVVAERRTDIAVLAALGARPRSIMLIFMLEGALLGALGAACGVVLGLLICALGTRYRWVSWPAGVREISYIPFHLHGADVLQTVLLALLLSLLATFYPAWAAARVLPAVAFKDGRP